MPKKVHLDSVNRTGGTVWFTLVFDGPQNFFVEERLDTNQPFMKNKVKEIPPDEFYKHTVNGVALSELVSVELNELVTSKLNLVYS